MAMGKSSSSGVKRRELRRIVPKPRPMWLELITRRECCWSAVHVALFIVIGGLIAWSAQNRPKYREGQQVFEPLHARVSFEAVDEQATAKNMEVAFDREPAVYVHNATYHQDLRDKLIGLAQWGMKSLEEIPEQTREAIKLDEAALLELKSFVKDEQPTPEWIKQTDTFLDSLFRIPVLSGKDREREPLKTQRAATITMVHPNPNVDHLEWWDPNLIDIEQDAASFLARAKPVSSDFSPALQPAVLVLLKQDLQPLYLLDENQTTQRKQKAFEQAGEQPERLAKLANALLVEPGSTLVKLHIQLLAEEQLAYNASIGPFRRMLTRGAAVSLIALLGIGLWVYVYNYKHRVTENVMRGLALTGLILLGQALAVGFTSFSPTLIYLMGALATLLVTFVVAIAYDQRFALAVGALHAVLVTVSLELPVGFALVLLTGVGVAAGQLNEVRSRSKLVWVGFWTGIAMFAAAWIVGLSTFALHVTDVLGHIFFNSLKVFSAGLLTGLLVQSVVLPAIERVFKVTTSMTLMELNIASHPLLRRLAQEAPGTYQHSLRLSDITEAAAQSIGANGLLCKVGAMYHDIGKTNKPLYFVENQGGGPNRHDKLSPAMSVLIIVGHVKDGIEMARQYHLPPVLRHFIESHHGTTLVEYFYHAARQKSEETDSATPTEFEFRYPGPKPQTKEAGIMLLGDNIESAARTLPEPTPTRLEQLTQQIATKRLMDGQFDQCNLTLRELHKIEESMTKTLCAIYHARVQYPEEQSKSPRELEPAGGESSGQRSAVL